MRNVKYVVTRVKHTQNTPVNSGIKLHAIDVQLLIMFSNKPSCAPFGTVVHMHKRFLKLSAQIMVFILLNNDN